MTTTLYVIAGACEVVGIVVLVVELSAARARLRAFAVANSMKWVNASDVVVMVDLAATGDVDGVEPTLEQRVAIIEADLADHRNEHPQIEKRLRTFATSEAEQKASDVQKSIQPTIANVVAHILSEGDGPWWRRWWLSPTLLVVGVLVGTVANIIAA